MPDFCPDRGTHSTDCDRMDEGRTEVVLEMRQYTSFVARLGVQIVFTPYDSIDLG